MGYFLILNFELTILNLLIRVVSVILFAQRVPLGRARNVDAFAQVSVGVEAKIRSTTVSRSASTLSLICHLSTLVAKICKNKASRLFSDKSVRGKR